MKINIVDSIMGSGKTTAAINYINNAPDDVKIIYVTPYLTEVQRIKEACVSKKFVEPVKYTKNTPKTIHLKDLLNEGRNIVTTHALFHYFDDEVIDLCYSQNYVLFMDEVTSVISLYGINKKDLEILMNNFVTVDDKGLLHWNPESDDYNGHFKKEKRLCQMESLAKYGNFIFWMFPVKIFNAFQESYILTYMFNAQMQKYYYDYHGLKYKYMYIEEKNDSYYFTDEKANSCVSKYDYSKLIKIINDEKLNKIGDLPYSLSKTWYLRNKNNIVMQRLKNNVFNLFKYKLVYYNPQTENWEKTKSSNNLWTTFKDYKKKLSGKGYAKAFVVSNTRATNEYKDRTVVAYLINKYFNPIIKNFFAEYGVEIDEDGYALSEMLQFLWRSGIREGKVISVYVPSKRMRELLENWIASQTT